MPNHKQEGSSNYVVEQIFGHYGDAGALDYFKKRLKSYCNDSYLTQMPSKVVTNYKSGVQRGKIHFHEAGYPYVENLLLLDALLNSNQLVMDIMGKDVPRKEALQRLRDVFKTSRSNIKQRLDLYLKVIDSSKSWDRLPHDFDLGESRLSEHKPRSDSETVTGPEAARFAAWERMREIDEEESTSENIAEKAFYLVRMGQRELGLKQIEAALVEFPQHSLLHFVKGMAFLDEAQHEERHAELHTMLIDESEPLSGAEYHHQEQASDRAENAYQKRLAATQALLDAYEYWPDHLPYNWFTNVSPWELQQQVTETILANGLWLTYSDRKTPAKLEDFLTNVARGKGLTRPLNSPEMFPTFGRCLALAHKLGETGLRNELIEKWLQAVEAEEGKTKGELTISPTYFISEHQPWQNPCPQLIAANFSQKSLADALTEHKGTKFYTDFVEKHVRLNAEQQLLRIFTQLNERFWRELAYSGAIHQEQSPNLCPELKRRVEVCEKAIKGLPWTTAYSEQWRIRWAYATTRSYFDLAVCYLVDGKMPQSKKMLKKVEALAATYPEISKKKHTHFVVSYVDDDGHSADWQQPLDMLGHPINIFVDKKNVSFDPNEGIGLFHPSCFDDGFDSFWDPLEVEAPEKYKEIFGRASMLTGTAVERTQKLLS